MAAVIAKFVFRTLCDNHGSLDFKRLDEIISQSFTVAEPVLRAVLFDEEKFAFKEGKEKVVGSQILNPDSLVVAKTSLRLCQKKPGECLQCDELHLCRYLVCGDCTFRHKCKNPHSLALAHNAELLKRHNLHDLTEEQLFQLLLQNDPYLLPEICHHYNKGDGVHGSCRFNTSCTKLHVCQHYFQGDCKFGSVCKRAHNLNAHGMKSFQGFSKENVRHLYELYRNKFIITGQQERKAASFPGMSAQRSPIHQPPSTNREASTGPVSPAKPVSDAERNEICLFFIRRHCSFKDKCARVHWHLPYRWQVLDRESWKDLPNMEDIERAYCDPNHDTSTTVQSTDTLGSFIFLSLSSSKCSAVPAIDFVTMTYGGLPVRRLSTASSVLKPPHFILTTEWIWYWRDDSGDWQKYGKSEADTPASITSQTLENVFLADRAAEIPFSAGKHNYILHFKGAAGTQRMYQQNVEYNTKREVARRPRFVSAQDVEMKLSASSVSSGSSTADIFPSYWDKSAIPDFGYRIIPLSKSAKEYTRIEKLFRLSMPLSTISSIQRIQNPSLWRVFQWQKEQMRQRNGGKTVNEQYLFHGTDESLIEAICEQNFDWRMCGVHGTAYGKGSYFARDASYSDRYSSVKQHNKKIMFVALVLVGEYTKGSGSFVRPPNKGTGRDLYDSCVNSKSDPSIYVVFEKQQIYPEYLISYS